jgi:hypothetical protein
MPKLKKHLKSFHYRAMRPRGVLSFDHLSQEEIDALKYEWKKIIATYNGVEIHNHAPK